MTGQIFDQPDVDFGRNFEALAERDIDFLLLEEFQVNADFVRWFCREIGVENIEPGGAWHSVFDADGETDLLLRVYQCADKIGVLIENKVAAAQQPSQGERYQLRGQRMITQGKLMRFRTVICAPESYLAGHDVGTYHHSVSYEQIARWFDDQSNQRAAWRAHVIREAIAQSRRGYVMVKDDLITKFQKRYWELLTANHPFLIMKEPGDRGPRSTWIILKGHGFPKGVHLNHKFDQRVMELAFLRTDKTKLLSARKSWPEDIIVKQKGGDATISIVVPKIDIRGDFDQQLVSVEEAFKAAERLMQYASILEQTPGAMSAGEDTATQSAEWRQRLEAMAKFHSVFEQPGFHFGQWTHIEGELPYFSLSETASEFIQMAYSSGWMSAFSWMDWENSDEALKLHNDRAYLAQANVEQLSKLLTTLIRKDRFVDGELANASESGLMQAIISRALVILSLS